MAEIILITGGARSGKSDYAQRYAEDLGKKRLYIATCPVIDVEMKLRIDKHKEVRAGKNWKTVEEQTNLVSLIKQNSRAEVILIDCLTLWINNLLHACQHSQRDLTEHEITEHCERVLQAGTNHRGSIVLVTNEVGLGIVPDNAAARQYRDLVGRCNQTMAAGADEVVLVSCGLPLTLKSKRQR